MTGKELREVRDSLFSYRSAIMAMVAKLQELERTIKEKEFALGLEILKKGNK